MGEFVPFFIAGSKTQPTLNLRARVNRSKTKGLKWWKGKLVWTWGKTSESVKCQGLTNLQKKRWGRKKEKKQPHLFRYLKKHLGLFIRQFIANGGSLQDTFELLQNGQQQTLRGNLVLVAKRANRKLITQVEHDLWFTIRTNIAADGFFSAGSAERALLLCGGGGGGALN